MVRKYTPPIPVLRIWGKCVVFRVSGLSLRVQGFRLWVEGLLLRVLRFTLSSHQNLGLRVEGKGQDERVAAWKPWRQTKRAFCHIFLQEDSKSQSHRIAIIWNLHQETRSNRNSLERVYWCEFYASTLGELLRCPAYLSARRGGRDILKDPHRYTHIHIYIFIYIYIFLHEYI